MFSLSSCSDHYFCVTNKGYNNDVKDHYKEVSVKADGLYDGNYGSWVKAGSFTSNITNTEITGGVYLQDAMGRVDAKSTREYIEKQFTSQDYVLLQKQKTQYIFDNKGVPFVLSANKDKIINQYPNISDGPYYFYKGATVEIYVEKDKKVKVKDSDKEYNLDKLLVIGNDFKISDKSYNVLGFESNVSRDIGPNSYSRNLLNFSDNNSVEGFLKFSSVVNKSGYLSLSVKNDKNEELEFDDTKIFIKQIPNQVTEKSLQGCLTTWNDNPNKTNCSSSFEIKAKQEIKMTTEKQTLWLRVDDKNSVYSDNSGTYDVKFTFQKVDKIEISALVMKIVNIIKNQIFKSQEYIFRSLTCGNEDHDCTDYTKIIKAILQIYIICYALGFLIGTIQLSHGDLVIRIIKIAIISMLISKSSWDFFYNHCFELFINGSTELIGKMNGSNNITNPFVAFDAIFGMFVSANFWFKLFSLIFSGVLGIVFFGLILYSMVMFFTSIMNIIKIYTVSFMFTGMLISLAPIFLPFMLFGITANLAEKWVRLLFRYMLEPVIVIVGGALISNAASSQIEHMFFFSSCLKCAIPIRLAIPGIGIDFGTVFCIPGFLPWGYDNGQEGLSFLAGGYVNISSIFAIITLVKIKKYFVSEFGSSLASSMTSTVGFTVSLTRGVGIENLIARNSGTYGGNDSGFIKNQIGRSKEAINRRKFRRSILTERIKSRTE